MKSQKILIKQIIIFILILSSCNQEIDEREIFIKPIDPETQQSELSRVLKIVGTNKDGESPAENNNNTLLISSSPSTATITSDNQLFIPFVYQTNERLAGVYFSIEGADNYWDIPTPNSTGTSYVLSIGVPKQILTGTFSAIFKPYDTAGNIAKNSTLVTTIVPKEDRCGNGRGFPRVSGSDGIVNRKYDLGDEAGVVSVTYNMFSVKDRMDIRYNKAWIKSTDDELLGANEAPPIKPCDEATASDGFVSGSRTFQFDYNPQISREVDIYVSGCLDGGTAWYFDVICPNSGNIPTPPSQEVWYDKLPDCPCEYENIEEKTTDPPGHWKACGKPFNDHYHYGATFEARWIPEDAPDSPGQQCMYDSKGQLITAGIAAGSPDKDSPDYCGNEADAKPDPGHIIKDVAPWEIGSCKDYLKNWPANNGSRCPSNSITDISHMGKMIGNMSCNSVVHLFKAIDNTKGSPDLLKQYIHQEINYTPVDLIDLLKELTTKLSCSSISLGSQCRSVKQAITNLED